MLRKILAANDGSPGAFAALTAAIDVAVKYGAELHMICIEEIPYFPGTIDEVEEERQEAEHRFMSVIERSKQLATQHGLSLEAHLLAGHPVPAIVELLRTRAFD